MSEHFGNDKNLPTKPDYEKLVFGTARPQSGKKGPEGENTASSGNGYDITVLAIVASALLVIITLCLVVVSRGMLVSHDGKFSFVFGDTAGDPFKTAGSDVPVVTHEGLDIDLSDPPMSVTPVENPGELTVDVIAEQVNPSVVAVMVSGMNGYSVVSGVVMTEDGFIVTSAEPLRWVNSVIVCTRDGGRYEASLVGMDLSSDIAVIKTDATGLDAAVFGNSDAVRVGDRVVAIGTPYDLALMGTTTSGIVSAINRNIVRGDGVLALMQSDITVAEGFAGGPLINKYGQIVGIITCSFGEDYSGFGFAVPMNTAKGIIEKIVNTVSSGRTDPVPSLGISAYFVEERIAEAYGLPEGLAVTDVAQNSHSYAMGLRAGDVITELDGVRLTDVLIYETLKGRHSVGDMVELTVYRDENLYDDEKGEYISMSVYLINFADIQ